MRTLAAQAAECNITLHLRLASGRPPRNLRDADALLARVGAANLRIAASTALLPGAGISPDAARVLKSRLGLWLAAAPEADVTGKQWNAHAPLHRLADQESVARWVSPSPEVPILLDAIYANQDEEYLDALALRRLQTTAK